VGEIKCLDACTDDFNRTHYTPQREDPPALQLRRSLSDSGDNRQQNYVNACPKGTTLTPFPMPIYDDDGLFVIDFRTVWFCLPADLEPAG
jgi:hypothetical protein